MRIFFLFFIIVPIIEMWILITIGSHIGALWTIALVALTAAIGLALLKQQGLNTLFRVNQRMQAGQLPTQEVIEGLLLAVGGALLLTPGFVTDALGFACLLPPSRKLISLYLLQLGLIKATGTAYTKPTRPGPPPGAQNSTQGDILEGEFRRED